MKALFVSLLLFSLLLMGCNSQPAPTTNKSAEPSWIMNPNQDGKSGAVGVAGRTYDQKTSTQRKLAITRALDELTLQRGVKVQLSMNKKEIVENERSSTHLDQQSSYDASSTLTAHIEQAWKNPLTGDIFVWMVID
ncbi:MAG: hypothetical protein GW906_03400 [Epsilonproteobacteria bacterium]|nr:hypothetical protein [Campylobacterota bacterium]OIO16073.1 MAG: hypothetical protein AUJ81_05295 [Helicobacteraceae bacterium CG1_02_36_14]PIP10214.1 MAG: hypothetical protein COX50_07005 [Sulfurimonas sp. CG23_combo_of_CG06-09_8_20_14_all_36_33]PIS26465.1 MAG: hypothetical protein COT46_02455 [Sulfurimonas sp. CG08_land_8_20_14_0_20_36_33]PIU33927.1 MAG: hypothetical protein COT05_09860 [Sulfurimonas sp. CG07_land_8_20_14_0_80_36_56]PIV03755.1 MAG: hypothetical protein COS56_07085 [Sulfur